MPDERQDLFVLVVILGSGELTKSLNVSAHRFTKGAKEKIEAAGGKTSLIGATTFEA